MPATAAERKRKQRQLDREDPDRKFRKLDSIYMFGEVDVSVIVDDDDRIWYKGVDIARALEMEAASENVYQTIDKKHCNSYENLTKSLTSYRDIPNMHPKTVFVNETGMNLFVMRSRKPKAEAFAEWVCGVVLPSIRKTNKYEVEPEENPYRVLNEYLQKQMDDMKLEKEILQQQIENQKSELTKELQQIGAEKSALEKELRQSENQKFEIVMHLNKRVDQLFEMKASCVPTLKNAAKQEYFILYKKNKSDDPFPYYACRIQLDSLEQRHKELLKIYPQMEKMFEWVVPNGVSFFNFVMEQMDDILERGGTGNTQSLKISKEGINETQMLTMIENLYRIQYGPPKKTE